jgi:hypothetical protein
MRQIWIAIILMLAFLMAGHAQSSPTQVPPKRPAANTASRPKPPQPHYLTAPLDVTLTNLGPAFMGHDITTLVEAIKKSPALTDKSEFESTAAFETRRAGFVDRPLYAKVTPSGYFGFVIGDDLVFAPELKYDADSQILAITLTGSTERFIMDKDQPTLDSFPIRLVAQSGDSYIGTNAFGAKVEVTRTYAEEYGVAFNQKNWLLQPTSDGSSRAVRYLLPMGPEEAKAMKADAKLLLVCRLAEPWFRHSAHGHDPTIDEPRETLVGDNYLQITPEQVWLFHHRTGEVIRKLSEASIANDKDPQQSLELRQTPLILKVSSGSHLVQLSVTVDDDPEKLDYLTDNSKTFTAKRQIILKQTGLMSPADLADLTFTLNGKPYIPKWTKDVKFEGTSIELIHSATTLIKVP